MLNTMQGRSRASGSCFALVLTLVALGSAPHSAWARSIYGNDDRKDVYDVSDAQIREWARSVPAVVATQVLSLDPKTGKYKGPETTYGKSNNLCVDERFYDQPVLSNCTSFLIAPDLVMTAGHCFASTDACGNRSFVFDFAYLNSEKDMVGEIDPKNVYKCKEVVDSIVMTRVQGGVRKVHDLAIVRLERPVADRKPLKLSGDTTLVDAGKSLTLIGNPMGLPTKVADGKVTGSLSDGFFVTSLDSFAGNSGSPVLSSTGEVVGILVRGARDLAVDPKLGCVREVKYASEAFAREAVTHMGVALEYFGAAGLKL